MDTDTFGGHLSAMDMLWAGVPILTMPGQGMASRVAHSALMGLQSTELIARNRPDYSTLLDILLERPTLLQQLRASLLRQSRATASIFDVVAHGWKDLQTACRVLTEVAHEPRTYQVVIADSNTRF